MNFLGANRLRIVGYFDELKAKVDERVEKCIAAFHTDEERVARINQVRTEWFKEIDECEKFNLTELEKRKDNDLKLEDAELFRKFMFEFELYGQILKIKKELFDLRLIAIDTFMSPSKVECFQIMMTIAQEQEVYYKGYNFEKIFVNMEQAVSEFGRDDRWLYIVPDDSFLERLNSSLEVIRVASEDQLAVVHIAELCFPFDNIHPDSQYLFRKTVEFIVEINVSTACEPTVDTAVSTKTSPDLFAAVHAMPELEELTLRIGKSVTRVDHFSPSLPKLRKICLSFRNKVEFAPTAFDHLVGLEELRFSGTCDNELTVFETGLAPRCVEVTNRDSANLLKLNSADVANIEKMYLYRGMVESKFPLSGVTELTITADETIDLSIFFPQFTSLGSLKIGLTSLNQIGQGQLSCLSKLTRLTLRSQDSCYQTNNLSGNGDMFRGLVSLKELRIQGFNLGLIESGAFEYLSDTLWLLELTSINWEYEPGAFKCLSKLKCLLLNQNAEEKFADLITIGELSPAVQISFKMFSFRSYGSQFKS